MMFIKRKVVWLLDRLALLRCRAEFSRLEEIKGLHIAGALIVNGRPLIDIRGGGNIYLAEGVVLNSQNNGYHLNMHSAVKLFVDRQGASISIGKNSRIHGSCIHAYQRIEIGKNCLIAANCQIMDGSGHDLSFDNVENRINTVGSSKPVVIEDNVWIGANSIVLPGVTIGAGSVIAAGSVVAKSIPSMVLAGGVPAVIIKTAKEIIAASKMSQ